MRKLAEFALRCRGVRGAMMLLSVMIGLAHFFVYGCASIVREEWRRFSKK